MTTPPLQCACGYVRGSTDEQRDTLIAQSEQIVKYCKGNDLTLATDIPSQPCFIDQGTSGTIEFFERDVAARMIAWMKANGVHHLVITKLDRGFRNALDCLRTIGELKAKGIHVHLLDIKLDTSTPIGTFVLTVMAAIAELENGRRSERQKDVFAVRKARNQRCGTIPYGYDLAPNEVDLVANAYEQKTLARILTGDLAGKSDNQTAAALNSAGTPAKGGGKWHGMTVSRLRARHREEQPKTA